jgi:phosphoribosylglycinamide formyltransferase 1
MTARVAILISGRGSNMAAILRAADEQSWDVDFCLVLSNRPGAGGLELARSRGIATDVLDHRLYGRGGRDRFDAALAARLEQAGAEWVVLAGFMRILGPGLLDPFAGRVLNIHPSLLPSFRGLHTHERALQAGVAMHGCTVHLVDASLDGGPVLAQAEVPVLPGDDADRLAARVLEQEHRLYPAVVRAAAEGRLQAAYPSRPQSSSPDHSRPDGPKP